MGIFLSKSPPHLSLDRIVTRHKTRKRRLYGKRGVGSGGGSGGRHLRQNASSSRCVVNLFSLFVTASADENGN